MTYLTINFIPQVCSPTIGTLRLICRARTLDYIPPGTPRSDGSQRGILILGADGQHLSFPRMADILQSKY